MQFLLFKGQVPTLGNIYFKTWPKTNKWCAKSKWFDHSAIKLGTVRNVIVISKTPE